MYSNSNAYSAYSQNNVTIESSEKLVKMLYEGNLRFVAQAKKAIENGDIEKKIYWINRSTAIFSELIRSLNFDSGDVALYLEGIYNQQLKLLTEANINNDTTKLDEVLSVTKVLLSTWNEEVVDKK